MIERHASAIGGINDLRRIGAVEGTHFRVSAPGEDITKYLVAVDTGQLVELLNFDGDTKFIPQLGFQGFAIVNADAMAMVGCPGIAGYMRDGSLPAEIAYLAVADE